MRNFTLITLSISVTFGVQLASGSRVRGRTIKSMEIVDYINNLEDISWRADSYNTDAIDRDTFVRTKLGVKMRGGHEKTRLERSETNFSSDEAENTSVLKSRGLSAKDGGQVPVNFTWTDRKNTDCPVGNIRDQSNCASCWAVAAASTFSDRLCIQSKGKIRIPISSNHAIACLDGRGCRGGYMSVIHNFFKINGTVSGGEYDSDEGCQPYAIRPCESSYYFGVPCASKVAWTPKCKKTKCSNEWYEYKYEPKMYKISEYHSVGSEMDEYTIKKEIYNNGPVTAVFYVFEDFLFYKSGVYDYKKGMVVGEHAARVVGWGEENGIEYWLAANSWSTSWGENGFFKIKRGISVVDFQSYMDAITPIVD